MYKPLLDSNNTIKESLQGVADKFSDKLSDKLGERMLAIANSPSTYTSNTPEMLTY